MKKVIGIGETILDILFKDNQPMKAVPGGSVFNSIISLGRMGANVIFVSEVGSDRVGDIVIDSLWIAEWTHRVSIVTTMQNLPFH